MAHAQKEPAPAGWGTVYAVDPADAETAARTAARRSRRGAAAVVVVAAGSWPVDAAAAAAAVVGPKWMHANFEAWVRRR